MRILSVHQHCGCVLAVIPVRRSRPTRRDRTVEPCGRRRLAVNAFLLSIHVVAAILAIGPVAVAASMFPRVARAAIVDPHNQRASAAALLLHRIVKVYTMIGIVVPVFGLATAASMGVLGDAWLLVSIAITALAAAILVALIVPGQRLALERIDREPSLERVAEPAAANDTETVSSLRLTGRLGMQTGMFNLLWVVVVIIMIVRPGSTTGAGL